MKSAKYQSSESMISAGTKFRMPRAAFPWKSFDSGRMLNSVLIDAIDCLFIHVKNHWLMGASYRLVQKYTSTILYFVIVFETVCCKYVESFNLKIPPWKK